MVGDGAMQLPQRWRGWDATPWGDGLLTCPTTGNHSPGIPRPLLALFSPAIQVLKKDRGVCPIYDRTLSGDYIGPLSPEWRNSPALRDMIAAFLVGLR